MAQKFGGSEEVKEGSKEAIAAVTNQVIKEAANDPKVLTGVKIEDKRLLLGLAIKGGRATEGKPENRESRDTFIKELPRVAPPELSSVAEETYRNTQIDVLRRYEEIMKSKSNESYAKGDNAAGDIYQKEAYDAIAKRGALEGWTSAQIKKARDDAYIEIGKGLTQEQRRNVANGAVMSGYFTAQEAYQLGFERWEGFSKIPAMQILQSLAKQVFLADLEELKKVYDDIYEKIKKQKESVEETARSEAGENLAKKAGEKPAKDAIANLAENQDPVDVAGNLAVHSYCRGCLDARLLAQIIPEQVPSETGSQRKAVG